MKHYVYRLDNPHTGEFYFGSRSSKCNPNDDSYMGSMKIWKPNISELVKTILCEFSSRKDANEYEYKIINEHRNDLLNRNYHSNKNFCTAGTTRVKENHHLYGKNQSEETKLKISENNARYWLDKKRPKHSELMKEISPTKGKPLTYLVKNKMKKKSIGRYTLDWFIEKYGETTGTEKYDIRNFELSERNKKIYSDKTNHPMFGKLGKDNPNSKKVYQYTKDNKLIKIWNGMSEAARELNIQQPNISSCCNGKLKTYGGYIWKFEQ
jgi:hypothetical protein